MSKSKTTESTTVIISVDRLISIPNYVPNPAEKKPYVTKADYIDVFKPFDPNKPKTAAKALYVIGKIPRTQENAQFIADHGDRLIIVSQRFLKLRKKMQTMLIEKACFELAGIPDRFITGMKGIDGTNFDKKLAAELLLMEKYGYHKVKRLLKKEYTIAMMNTKKAGCYLYKAAKKSAKAEKKNTAPATTDTKTTNDLKQPIRFSETAPATIATV